LNDNIKFKGVFIPIITIFKENEEVNYDGIKNHVEYLINAGVNGIISGAATSEFFHLSVEERKNIAETIVKQVNRRIPVVIGTAANATKESIELSKHAEYIGADGVMINPPSYWHINEDEICLHYGMIGKKVSLPIIVYNDPSVSYTNISPKLLLRMKNVCSNIKYVKDSSNSINNIQDILLNKTNLDVDVFVGEEPICLYALYVGCVGIISLIANGIPEFSIEMVNLFYRNAFIEARQLHYKFLPLMNYLFFNDNKYSCISIVKSILKLRNRNVGITRMPMMSLPQKEEEKLYRLLKDREII